ncbi:hypothetical protein [Limnohabitans sp. T6-5]|uniref:hypothetical protein n=1 Tax=Limnohabitans sp. T6-5 TaxID=1100724 RepID=UPI000D360CCC|nr:hypothetical protein [Limnohabitans sp. T6-5]
MKSTLVLLLACICASSFAAGSHSRKSHIRKNGTYVAPSRATNPDHTRANNYSHQGNVNPYNGKQGTKP